jgi:dipeptide/tripeptide permease (peptide:H+ symporter)
MSKTFFGQPRQLSTLFHIELWERFSFYGMNSILAMYLYHSVTKGGLGFSEAVGGSIATAYGGSVYLSTIFGGWVPTASSARNAPCFIPACWSCSATLPLPSSPASAA